MIIDDLERVKRYVDDAGLGEYGWRDSESTACVKIIDEAITEIQNLKSTIMNQAAERANWQYLIRELEDKLKIIRGELK